MRKFIKIILSFPFSVYFNFRYLKWTKAYKVPIYLSYNTIISIDGIIDLPDVVSFAMIRIGFHKVPICNDNDVTSLTILRDGHLVFDGSAHIGNGTKIFIASKAYLRLGDNFAVSASSAINCYRYIKLGKNIQFSWDCLVMDSDTHTIFDDDNTIINESKEVILGDKIWIGCRVTILKGTIIPNNCVIGAGSLVVGSQFNDNSIIAGCPAKSIRYIANWEI